MALPLNPRSGRRWDRTHSPLGDIAKQFKASQAEVIELYRAYYPEKLQELKDDVEAKCSDIEERGQGLHEALNSAFRNQDSYAKALECAQKIAEFVRAVSAQAQHDTISALLEHLQFSQPQADIIAEATLRQERDDWRSKAHAWKSEGDTDRQDRDNRLAVLQKDLDSEKLISAAKGKAAETAYEATREAVANSNRLEKKNKDQEARITQLNQDLERAEKKATNSDEERKRFFNNLQTTNNTLDQHRLKYQDLFTEHGEAKTALTNAQLQLVQTKEELRKIQLRLKTAQDSLSDENTARERFRKEHEEDISTLNQTISNQKRQHDEAEECLKATIARLKEDKADAKKARGERMQELLAAHEREIVGLNETHTSQLDSLRRISDANLKSADDIAQKSIDLEREKRTHADDRTRAALQTATHAEGKVQDLEIQMNAMSEASKERHAKLVEVTESKKSLQEGQEKMANRFQQQTNELIAAREEAQSALQRSAKFGEQQQVVSQQNEKISELEQQITDMEFSHKDQIGKFGEQLKLIHKECEAKTAKTGKDSKSELEAAKKESEQRMSALQQSHQQRIKHLNGRIFELTDAIAKCEGKCEAHQTSLANAQSERDDARRELLSELEKKSASMQDAAVFTTEQKERQKGLEKNAEEAQKSLKEAQSKLVQLQSEIDVMKGEVKTLRGVYQEEQNDHEQTRQARMAAVRDGEEWQNQLEMFNAEWCQYEAQEKAKYEQQISELEEAIEDQKKITTETSTAQRQLQQVTQELERTKTSLTTQTLAADSRYSELQDLYETIRKLEAACEATAPRAQEIIRNELLPIRKENNGLKKEILDLEQKLDTAQEECQKARDKKERMAAKRDSAIRRHGVLHETLKDAVKDINTLRRRLAKAGAIQKESLYP